MKKGWLDFLMDRKGKGPTKERVKESVEKPKKAKPPGKPDPFHQGQEYGWPSDGLSIKKGRSGWVKAWRDRR